MNNESAISTVGLSKIYNKKNQKIRALDRFSILFLKASLMTANHYILGLEKFF